LKKNPGKKAGPSNVEVEQFLEKNGKTGTGLRMPAREWDVGKIQR